MGSVSFLVFAIVRQALTNNAFNLFVIIIVEQKISKNEKVYPANECKRIYGRDNDIHYIWLDGCTHQISEKVHFYTNTQADRWLNLITAVMTLICTQTV